MKLNDQGVCVVGAQPPPVQGMAMVNKYFADALKDKANYLLIVDLSPRSLSRSRLVRLRRISRVLGGLIRVLANIRNWHTMYVGLSGGAGQLYETLFIFLARCFGKKLFLHHHSFAYLDSRKTVTRITTLAAGSATHIVLCEKMRCLLQANYASVKKIHVLSNAAFIAAHSPIPTPKTSLNTIGYLSNISEEKGIFQFLGVMEKLSALGLQVRGLIAGPFQNLEIENAVMMRLKALDNVQYVGPKYGGEKDAFFAHIDVLLFPTRYVNEAEPLTLYEAMAAATPIIPWDRGCISHMLPNNSVVVPRDGDFIDNAVNKLLQWKENEAELNAISLENLNSFNQRKQRSQTGYEQVLDWVCHAGRS